MSGAGAWRDWFTLARASNLPTVWSNVLVGVTAGHVVVLTRGDAAADVTPMTLAGLIVAMSLIYTAGMILNDVFDVPWDRTHRPERPIAAGRVDRRRAIAVVVMLFAIALVVLGVTVRVGSAMGLAALLIVGAVAYDWLHKRWGGAVVLMGACRALVYLTAAAAVTVSLDAVWWYLAGLIALLMGVYVTGVTFLARREVEWGPDARRWLGLILWVWPLLALLILPVRLLWLVPTGAAMAGWLGYAAGLAMARPARLDRAVPAWLAGIALIDAWLLVLLGVPSAALVAGMCFALSVFAQRWVAAS